MTLISRLREPKINIGGIDLAIFDLSATTLAGYIIAKKQNWSIPLTIGGLFITGHMAHNLMDIPTPLTTRINESFATRPEDGITISDLPINNSTDPVGIQEIRYSSF